MFRIIIQFDNHQLRYTLNQGQLVEFAHPMEAEAYAEAWHRGRPGIAGARVVSTHNGTAARSTIDELVAAARRTLATTSPLGVP